MRSCTLWAHEASRQGLFLGTIGGTTASIMATARMQLYTSATAQSLSRTPGVALFEWCNLVRLRGSCLLRDGSLYCMSQVEPSRGLGPTCGWCLKSYSRFPWSIGKKACFIFSDTWCQQTFFLLNHLCRRGSASTTGTLGPDVEKKTHLKNRLRWNGISLPCRKRLTMWIMTFSQNDSTWPTSQAARFSSIRIPSFLTSMSNLSTFMTQDEACLTKS